MWDLVLSGGRVLDPASGRDEVCDVAVRGGRVAEVGRSLPRDRALQLEDVSGSLVTPGLVDLHTHVFHGGTFWGVDPTAIAWRTGVTTWVDAGSAGAYNLPALQRLVDTMPVRVPTLLNVSAIGLVGETGEHHRLEHVDVPAAAATVSNYSDAVVGVKVRIDSLTVGPHGLEPLHRALELAHRLGRPLMVHIGYGPPDLGEITPLMREGDILTHCASGCASGIVAEGELTDAAKEAVDRGVIFDLGHGSGAFDFDTLDVELAAGIMPVISSDLHIRSVYGPAFDLPTVMMKLLASGAELPDVVAGATTRPASTLPLSDSAGSLSLGAPADIAIFELEEGAFPVVDVHGATREAPFRLTNTKTYVAGRPLAPQDAPPPPPWVTLSAPQQRAEAARIRDLRTAASPRLSRPRDFGEPFPKPGTHP